MRLSRSTSPSAPGQAPRAGGFTVIEIMIVVLILAIISVLSVSAVANFEANQRADRAAREALAVFRFARNLAMTSGKNATVRVISSDSPPVAVLAVYHKRHGTANDAYDYTIPHETSLNATRTMVLDLYNSRELLGSRISPIGTTDFEFNVLGSCSSPATLTFSFGGRSKAVTIRGVGDPVIP
jgi:prepilin-type N-terminal cleavage/methylation domain-containing protein